MCFIFFYDYYILSIHFISASNIRYRTRINFEQQQILKKFYEKNSFPSVEERSDLELLTGLSSKVVQVWFKNRRQENRIRKN